MEAKVALGREVLVEGRVLEHQPDVAADGVALADHVVPGDQRGRPTVLGHERRRQQQLLEVFGEHRDRLRIGTPLELGADVVVHSVTKFLSGHSDVLAGVAVVKEGSELAEALRDVQQSYGAVLDPFSAWLAMRGMRTLAVRIRTQCLNASRIANFLLAHPQIAAVHYPGLPSHPGHEIARSQMDDFGGMLSFEMKSGAEAAKEVVRRCRVFRRATSLGGTESLIEHRASIEQLSAIPDSLIRVSTGIEHIDDLLDDLSQALREG